MLMREKAKDVSCILLVAPSSHPTPAVTSWIRSSVKQEQSYKPPMRKGCFPLTLEVYSQERTLPSLDS